MNAIARVINKLTNNSIVDVVKYRNATINYEPLFILGNPKSGTTAIATLISYATGKSLTSDFIRAIPRATLQLEMKFKLLHFQEFMEKYKYEFSKELIKSPLLTFFIKELKQYIPQAKYIFIARDPFQNIRSILNRLKIPGNLKQINLFEWDELNKTPAWKLQLQSQVLGYSTDSYIEAMAYRWNYAVEGYFKNKDKMLLVRYEDFKKDKENYIYRLCEKMDMLVKHNISSYLNVQFQPKGNQDIDIISFFGDHNVRLIKEICQESMLLLGYE